LTVLTPYCIARSGSKEKFSTLIRVRPFEKLKSGTAPRRGITTRRLYDENDRLIAGLWQQRNGVQTFYQQGKNAELRLAERNNAKPFNAESLWYEEPTAVSFLRLVGKSPSLQTEELASTYLMSIFIHRKLEALSGFHYSFRSFAFEIYRIQ
jgi:hypothetical protein